MSPPDQGAVSPLRQLRIARLAATNGAPAPCGVAVPTMIPELTERMEEAIGAVAPQPPPRTMEGLRHAGVFLRPALARSAVARLSRLARPRLLAVLAACGLAGLTLHSAILSAQSEHERRAQRDHARIVGESLNLLQSDAGAPPSIRGPVLAAAAASEAPLAAAGSNASADGTSGDRSDGLPAEAPYPTERSDMIAPAASTGARPPIGRYLDGPPDPDVPVPDPLESMFIKTQVAPASAPFTVLQVREQQFGFAALVSAKDHPAAWLRPGHIFPNGWTLVDVTPDGAALLSPEGRVLRVPVRPAGRKP